MKHVIEYLLENDHLDRDLSDEIQLLDLLYKSYHDDGNGNNRIANEISDLAEELAIIDDSEGMYVLGTINYDGDVIGAYDEISKFNKKRYIPIENRQFVLKTVSDMLASKHYTEFVNRIDDIKNLINKD